MTRPKRCAVPWEGPPAFGLIGDTHTAHACVRPPGHPDRCSCYCGARHDPAVLFTVEMP